MLTTAPARHDFPLNINLRIRVGFRDFNGEGGGSLPKLFVDFSGGIFCSLDVFCERFCDFKRRLVFCVLINAMW